MTFIKNKVHYILRPKDQFFLLIVYVIYLLIIVINCINSKSSLKDIPIYPVSIHFVIVLGYISYIGMHEKAFIHDYFWYRYGSRRAVYTERLKLVLFETAVYWGPLFIIIMGLCITTREELLVQIAGNISILINLSIVGIVVEFIAVLAKKRFISNIITFLALCIDYLMVSGMFFVDYSYFYGPMIKPFYEADLMSCFSQVASSMIRLLVIVAGTYIVIISPKKLFSINRHILSKVLIAAAVVGIIMGIYGAAVIPGETIEAILMIFGGMVAEGEFGIREMIIYTFPFIVQLLLFGDFISKDSRMAAVFLFTRQYSPKGWVKRKICGCAALSLFYYVIVIFFFTIVRVVFINRMQSLDKCFIALGLLIVTGGLSQFIMVLFCNVTGLRNSSIAAFIIAISIFLGGFIITSLPANSITETIKHILPSSRGMLLNNELSGVLARYQALSNNQAGGMELTFTILYEILLFVVFMAILCRNFSKRDYI